MESMEFTKAISGLNGELAVPGDKSISHRAVMFGSIAKGLTEIRGFLQGADCLSTIACFRRMGVGIDNLGDRVLVHGNGMRGLKRPAGLLDCGNSGTTMRLISGILAAQNFDAVSYTHLDVYKRQQARTMAGRAPEWSISTWFEII